MRRTLERRADRALERQLAYMRRVAAANVGREDEVAAVLTRYSQRIRDALSAWRPIGDDDRVLEVGCGAGGAIFYWSGNHRLGIDPLADHYRELFPWHAATETLAVAGESLPFPDQSWDVVICDNVVDHARDPAKIVREIARVMKPGGALYFGVHVHHPIYRLASQLHGLWNGIGLRYEITPFADHTVHLTPRAAKRLFDGLPLERMSERVDFTEARAGVMTRPRHMGDRLKRLFYKNAAYELIAIREPAAT